MAGGGLVTGWAGWTRYALGTKLERLDADPEAVFRLDPGVGHDTSAEMARDVVAFLRRALEDR